MLDSLTLWVGYFCVITRLQFLPVARAPEDYEEAVGRRGKGNKTKALAPLGLLAEGVKDACWRAVLIVALTDPPPPIS